MDRPSWIGHAWSLKNKGLFRIGLVDRPRGLDSLTLPEDWTPGPSLVDRPLWTLKNKELFRIGLADQVEP